MISLIHSHRLVLSYERRIAVVILLVQSADTPVELVERSTGDQVLTQGVLLWLIAEVRLAAHACLHALLVKSVREATAID